MKAVTFHALFGGLLFVFFAVMSAHAQTTPGPAGPQCGPWPDGAATLMTRFGETILFDGDPAPGQARVIITAKPDGSTWTALTVWPDGRTACQRSAGGGWRIGAAPPPAGEEG